MFLVVPVAYDVVPYFKTFVVTIVVHTEWYFLVINNLVLSLFPMNEVDFAFIIN